MVDVIIDIISIIVSVLTIVIITGMIIKDKKKTK